MPHDREWQRRSMRLALASTIAGAYRLSMLGAQEPPGRPLILGYHRVVEDFRAAADIELPSMLISLAMFERHLDWLGQRFEFVGLDAIGEHADNGEPFDRPSVALTFDDGYRDVYEHAFPVLRRRGITAGVFAVTDLIGQSAWHVHDTLYHLLRAAFARWTDPHQALLGILTDLDIPAARVLMAHGAPWSPRDAVGAMLPTLSQAEVRQVLARLEDVAGPAPTGPPRSLTWSMLTEMRRAGFTIGSHTRTHASLPMETPEDTVAELVGSKQALEAHLGEPVVHFAYPGGHFTPQIVDAVTAAGYRFAYTACPHGDVRQPAATMERLLLWEGSSIDGTGRFSPAVLDCQVHDRWPPARHCERLHHA